jgi:tRNA threonylcarbamoyladenosine biosynthesis protein TsaE|tara:strand:- start:699 stop:1151 length:453 start_codon:yes stop_codon:yes gene_type:complete
VSFSFTVKHEDELFEITNKLAPTLKNQKIIFIEGGVGAGKTTFIRYLLETLAKNNQSKFFFQGSPTYQRENQYYFNQLNCVHFDFYQVEDSLGIDLEDYIIDHCLFIEWPLNSLKKRYQQEALFIKVKTENNYRTIEMHSENLQWLHQIQ